LGYLYLLVMEAILAWASGGGSVRIKRLNRLTVHVQQILDRLELMCRERCYAAHVSLLATRVSLHSPRIHWCGFYPANDLA
ncbi:hypothetical protein, partial [Pseudomonas viridiflava]|uniref:hypothetical protein n=1 Tax=Pseudomonas viridiflava TaxID=33069 RepID=UPI0019811D2C